MGKQPTDLQMAEVTHVGNGAIPGVFILENIKLFLERGFCRNSLQGKPGLKAMMIRIGTYQKPNFEDKYRRYPKFLWFWIDFGKNLRRTKQGNTDHYWRQKLRNTNAKISNSGLNAQSCTL